MNTYKFLQEEGVIHSCTVAVFVFFLCSISWRCYIVTLLVELFVYKTVCRLVKTDCCCASGQPPTWRRCTQRHCAISKLVTLYTRSRHTGSNYICCVRDRDYTTHGDLEFIPLTLWPPNSPDLNPVHYKVWSVMQEKVYKK